MVFLRRRTDEEKTLVREEANNSEQPTRLLFPARQLPHHYILEPIGKPQNATNDGEVHDSIAGKPLIVMPPGPVVVEEEEHDEEDLAKQGGGSDEVEHYVDHDSGEDKVAAMIAEMQAKAADGGHPSGEEDNDNEGNTDEQVETTAPKTSASVPTQEPSDGDDNDVPLESSEPKTEDDDTEGEMDVDEVVAEDTPEEEVETTDEQSSEQLATLEPVNGDNENTNTSETMDEDNGEAPAEIHDDIMGNEENQKNVSEIDEVEPEEDAPGEENASEGETVPSETLATPGTASAVGTGTIPTSAPTALSSEQDVVITASPSPAPSALAEGESTPSVMKPIDVIPNAGGEPSSNVAESPAAEPSETHTNTEKDNHEHAPEPKAHETQPHSDTSGITDASSPSFGALACRHPNGLAQTFNCKVIHGVQSHPLAFSAAFFVVFVWGCCLCRRMCKGGSRRDEQGEYREIAAQYDDVLFQDTFDDNYSASFGDDRSADGSIMSDEEDDWRKGPNIEMSGISRQKDDLTLEEMNG